MSTSSRSSRPTCRTGYSAAPNSVRCRSAASTSAIVAARNPSPSSSIANSPRPWPLTRQRRSGIPQLAIAVPARSLLPFGSAGTFPAGDAPDRDRSRSTTTPDSQYCSLPASDATSRASCSASTSSASSSHSASSSSSRRIRATMKRNVVVSSFGPVARQDAGRPGRSGPSAGTSRPAFFLGEDGLAELQRVPVDDDRDQQVEAGDPVVLSFRGSVSQFAALVEVDRALEGMVSLALVQSNLGASAHVGVRGPVDHEQRAFDAADFPQGGPPARSGSANTNRLLPRLGRSSGVRSMKRGVPVLTATYCRPSTA